MRTAKLVRDLVVEDALIHSDGRVRCMSYEHLSPLPSGAVLEAKIPIRQRAYPVCELFELVKEAAHPADEPEIEETYIAWTEEVENLLRVPFNETLRALQLERESGRQTAQMLRDEMKKSEHFEQRLCAIVGLGLFGLIRWWFTGHLPNQKV